MSEPQSIIQDFFSALPLSSYRKYINSCLVAACRRDYWRKEDPGSLIYFQKKMEDLMDAAKSLSDLARTSKSGFVLLPAVLDQKLIDPEHYMDQGLGHTQWESFPRNLSKREFLDPYLVFKRFFRYKSQEEWHNDFREIISYALSPHSCLEDLTDLNLLKINRLLLKLTEAAHLIMLRGN